MAWFARQPKWKAPKDLVPWDNRLAITAFSEKDWWTLGDAYEGTVVFGATGAGKTSGPGKHIARQLLRTHMGGLVLTVKPDEADAWEAHAEAAGKSEFVMRVRPGGEYRFNFLQYASRRPGAEIGLAENLADLITTLGRADGSGGDAKRTGDAYWDQALKQLVRNVVSVLHIAEGEITLDSLMGVIATLPEDPEHATEIEWQQRTTAGQMFQKLRSLELDAKRERSLRVGAEFLLQEFPALDPRTRSSIVSTLTTLLDPFRHGEAYELFCTDCTIIPEACRLGAIVILDLDLKTYGAFGRLGQVLFKWFVQQSVERDKIDAKTRGMFIYADEAQEFLTTEDKRFQATARSARVATVYLTQNLPALQARLGNEAEVHGLLGNLQTKIFCQNADPSTN